MDKAQLSKRIKDRREFLKETDDKWTQAYVAELLGFSREAWVAKENGRNEILATELPAIAEVLGASVTYLMAEEDAPLQEVVYEPILDELRTAGYNGGLEDGDVEEIAAIIRMKAKRRAKKRGAA